MFKCIDYYLCTIIKKVEPTALVALGSPCVTPIGFKPITF